jgi:G:T-mismatch repair DNA endonuclease (very short patch repair protein)
MLITKDVDNENGIDPFINSLTMPSVCHEVYRKLFMPVDSIALIPAFGYQNPEASSYKAIIWLKYISLTQNITILHSRNGGEKKILSFKLDGWHAETKTAYEFHGCVFHGCPRCYNESTFNALKNERMSQTYMKHLKRIELIKDNISNMVEIWECQFDELTKTDELMRQLVRDESDLKHPLKPRDALSGGRTNAIVLHYEGDADYIDFTSLYPYVQKYGTFPIGHPEIITENFDACIDNYFGLVFCRILPPRNLYHPVLPYHSNGKLLFPLCALCAQQSQQENCEHAEEDRCLEGTWVSLEIKTAVANGYQIKKVFEIWHWARTEQYNPLTKSGGLFTSYVNCMLKIKQEASGYPAWVESEEEKDRYIQDYYDKEGIRLDKNKIKSNSGLKALSKLLLNSQWGRYAMQTLKTVCKFVRTYQDLIDYFNNSQYEVKNLLFPTDDTAMILYEDNKDMHWGSNQTNVVIAAFVTAQARLKLFNEMLILGERVLYVDTDSIIYKRSLDLYTPKLGDFLGEFTNEIDPNEGNHIVEFVSAGPKNYSYKLDTGIFHSKVKGFSLNFAASKKIDFNRIKQIVCKMREENITIDQSTIVRNKQNWTLKTKTTAKIYRMVYDKRIIQPDLSTLPYGFK